LNIFGGGSGDFEMTLSESEKKFKWHFTCFFFQNKLGKKLHLLSLDRPSSSSGREVMA